MQSTPITPTRETELTIASNRRYPDTLTANRTTTINLCLHVSPSK
jgi:hypothetical protein